MTSRKRSRDESDEVNEYSTLEDCIASPTKSAKVRGVLSDLSPMKVSRNGNKYFKGMLTDETKSLEFVGYDKRKLEELNRCKDSSVTFDNCEIKESKIGSGMDMCVKSTTSISHSPKKINPIVHNLGQLQQLQEYEFVTLSDVKVLEVPDAMKVSSGFVQDVIISDAGGTGTLTLWDDDRDKLEVGKFYKLNSYLRVKIFNGQKGLTPPKSCGLSFQELLSGVTVKAVSICVNKHVCITCEGHVNLKSICIGQCTQCFAFQRLGEDKEPIAVELLISCNGQDYNLKASFPEIKSIVDLSDNDLSDNATEVEIAGALLMASPFSLTFKDNRIIEEINKLLI